MTVDSLDPNLLASTKKPKTDLPLPEAHTPSPRSKKILKIAAYALIFLSTFLLFLTMKIPDSFVTNLTLNTLNTNTPYRWQADKILFRFFFFPHLVFEKLELEPKLPGQGVPLSVAKLKITPSPFALIPIGGPSAMKAAFTADAYGTTFNGHLFTGGSAGLGIEAESLDLSKLTPLQQAGLDIQGLLTVLMADLTMENQRLSRSDGLVKIAGKNIVLDPASLGSPIPLPIMSLGVVHAEAKVERGKLEIQKFQLGSPGSDLELTAQGNIQLADTIDFSRLDLRIQIKFADKIKKAVPSLDQMLATLSAPKPNGFYGLKISGTINALGMPQPDR